jgi:NADPH-dependent ferric siderophore reductase
MADTSAVSADTTDIAAELAARAPDILYRLNVDFEDSVLFIGRALCGRPDAARAEVTTVDPVSATLVVSDADGDHEHRLPFGNAVTDVDQLTLELFAFVLQAREQAPDAPLTEAERAMQSISELRTFLTRVVAVEDLHPHLRQITFGGGDLATFSPAGPDTFLYLLLPPPGRTELTIDQSFSWEAHAQMPDEDKPVGAYYTLRRWRPEAQEMDMLFVLHGDTGPASAWAARARPGDPVALWGPRTAYAPPADTDWYLLVADETGLPAVASILESLPAGTVARVFAEVDNPGERQDLPDRAGTEVTWLYRDGAPPGTTTLLADAVRALPWPGGTPYAWGGGESRAMTAVRKYVRQEIGLAREQVSLVAYWRHATHAGDPADDEE